MFKILLSHAQYITRIGEEHVTPLDILCHILILALLEVLQLLLVVCLNPACLVQVNRLPATLGIVLVFQAILDYLKLKLPHSTYDATAVELVDKQLSHTLIHQLLQSFLELFTLHWIIVLNVLEEKW